MYAHIIVKRVSDFLKHLLVDVNNLYAIMAFILNHNAHLTLYLLHSNTRVVWSFQLCTPIPISVSNQADTDCDVSIDTVNRVYSAIGVSFVLRKCGKSRLSRTLTRRKCGCCCSGTLAGTSALWL